MTLELPSSVYWHIQSGNEQHFFTSLRNNSEVDYPSWTQSLDLSHNGLYLTFRLDAGSAITDFIYQAHWAYICASMNSLRNDNLEFRRSNLSIGQAISPSICPPVSEVSVHFMIMYNYCEFHRNWSPKKDWIQMPACQMWWNPRLFAALNKHSQL